MEWNQVIVRRNWSHITSFALKCNSFNLVEIIQHRISWEGQIWMIVAIANSRSFSFRQVFFVAWGWQKKKANLERQEGETFEASILKTCLSCRRTNWPHFLNDGQISEHKNACAAHLFFADGGGFPSENSIIKNVKRNFRKHNFSYPQKQNKKGILSLTYVVNSTRNQIRNFSFLSFNHFLLQCNIVIIAFLNGFTSIRSS